MSDGEVVDGAMLNLATRLTGRPQAYVRERLLASLRRTLAARA
jgi:hypothetical protein